MSAPSRKCPKRLEGLQFAKIEGGYQSTIGFICAKDRQPGQEAQSWRDGFIPHFRRIHEGYYRSL